MNSQDTSSHTQSNLSALTLLVVLAAGFISAAVNPALLRSPDASFADGSWAVSYQDAFSQELLLMEPARAIWNAVDLAVFGQTPSGVVGGSNGWLFTAEEYATADDPATTLHAWLQELSVIRDELADHGIPLLIALVPAKAGSVSWQAPPLPEAAADRYRLALIGLGEYGISTVDLRPALAAERAWLRTDTHWSPEGADAAAGLISAAARQIVPDLGGSLSFETVTLEPEPFEGDLSRLLALGPFDGIGPEPDSISRREVQRAAGSSGDLFAAPDPDLVLVGTSYSAATEWNLADRLRLGLDADVLDISDSGRGHLAPMQDYLLSGALQESPPELVVWEIPERYLTRTEFLDDQEGSQ